MPMITGVLRKWQRRFSFQHGPSITGYIYESDIWDEGEYAELMYVDDSQLVESTNYFLLVLSPVQVYKLPKDEQVQ